MSKAVCYLDTIPLDLVTENDHLSNYCFCSKCTCGKHICPKPSPKLYPKSIFNSYYKINYKRHSLARTANTSAPPRRKSLFKLEAETTARHDYKAYPADTSYIIDASKPLAETGKYHLSSSSVYKQDYANWGHMKAESTKNNKASVGSEVQRLVHLLCGLSEHADHTGEDHEAQGKYKYTVHGNTGENTGDCDEV